MEEYKKTPDAGLAEKTQEFLNTIGYSFTSMFQGEKKDKRSASQGPLSSNFEELSLPAGYATEAHYTTTDDGVILKLYRIPGAKDEKPASYRNANKPAVLLQHGLLDSADGWIVNEEDKSIGFALANCGYDVWFGNCRGNKYCLYGTHQNYDNSAFWNFTWEDMAKYDLTTTVNFITEYTGQDKIAYVGHSQGCLIMFAALADAATAALMNSKINIFIALAPAVYIKHNRAEILETFKSMKLTEIMEFFGSGSFFVPAPYGTISPKLMASMCSGSKYLSGKGPSLVSDMDPSLLDEKKVIKYLSHFPSGTSVKNMTAWVQKTNSNKFRKFDYGPRKNLQIYGTEEPPLYDFSLLKVPTAIMVGESDMLVCPQDARLLRTDIEQFTDALIYYSEYKSGHLGFFANDEVPFLPHILELLSQYSNQEEQLASL